MKPVVPSSNDTTERASARPIFTPEDFAVVGQDPKECGIMCDKAADIANARLLAMTEAELTALLEAHGMLGPEVYGSVEFGWWVADEQDVKNEVWQSTHCAYLFQVRPIEQAKCEHTPSGVYIRDDDINPLNLVVANTTCSKCGVVLRAKWEVSE